MLKNTAECPVRGLCEPPRDVYVVRDATDRSFKGVQVGRRHFVACFESPMAAGEWMGEGMLAGHIVTGVVTKRTFEKARSLSKAVGSHGLMLMERGQRHYTR